GNRAKNTPPEILVRRLLPSPGYHSRLHRKDLPGCPDIAFIQRRKVIFVHGCFWHRHARCPLARPIKSNRTYWNEKLRRNLNRDARNEQSLRQLGWEVLILRECELDDPRAVTHRLVSFLGDPVSKNRWNSHYGLRGRRIKQPFPRG